jgi:hypothetical protein
MNSGLYILVIGLAVIFSIAGYAIYIVIKRDLAERASKKQGRADGHI